jgi:hypothetical protein
MTANESVRKCLTEPYEVFSANLRHLDSDVRRASTIWHEMTQEDSGPGLVRLAADLESGAWDERHGHLREKTPELDLGLRLLVAELG